MNLTDLIEQLTNFLQGRETHRHEYRVIDGIISSETPGVRWKQYECTGCTKTLCAYNGRKPKYKKVEAVENLLKERYQLK
ncbi:MAG: hypothetical protein AABX39_03625 [Nanoarchaeota archaeon]